MDLSDAEQWGPKFYDRLGRPLKDVEAWTRLFEQDGYRRLAETEVSDGVVVSTVWLGLDHAWLPGVPPLIFETMVFGGPLDQEQERYTTEAQALAGHDQMVARARDKEAGLDCC